jgi:hypothetical protein
MTGRLADEALFEFAQWMRTVHVSSGERDWFFKLKLVRFFAIKRERTYLNFIDATFAMEE